MSKTKQKIQKGDYGYIKSQQKKKDPVYDTGASCPPSGIFYRFIYSQNEKYRFYCCSCSCLSSCVQICCGHDYDVYAEAHETGRLRTDRKA